MIVPAKLLEAAYREQYAQAVLADPERFVYLSLGPACHHLPSIAENDWNAEQRLSVTMVGKDHSVIVHGYMSASVDRETNCVSNCTLLSLRPCSATFARDAYSWLRQLRASYRLIRWCVIEGNPAGAIYRKLISRLGGEEVGFFRHYARLRDGRVLGVRWYEIPGTEAAR